jgi:hypothetical protein
LLFSGLIPAYKRVRFAAAKESLGLGEDAKGRRWERRGRWGVSFMSCSRNHPRWGVDTLQDPGKWGRHTRELGSSELPHRIWFARMNATVELLGDSA